MKKRLKRLQNTRPNRWAFNGLIVFTLGIMSFWLVSCSDTVSNEQMLAFDRPFSDVRSITTRFTSHQSDTQEKSDRIVAVAYFAPDQSLMQFDQHMTYPYTMDAPEKKRFWAQPEATKVQLIMDGLDLGDAENNILYGNDWPAQFANVAESGHPRFKRGEYNESESTVNYGGSNYPQEIVTKQRHEYRFMTSPLWIERFSYDDGKVKKYESFYESSSERLKINTIVVKSQNTKSVEYDYEEDKLTNVKRGNSEFKFMYEGDLLIRSEFYIKGKMYNYRNYFYSDNGLKTRTEIFNVNGDPEYTIHYDYEFYELSQTDID